MASSLVAFTFNSAVGQRIVGGATTAPVIDDYGPLATIFLRRYWVSTGVYGLVSSTVYDRGLPN